MINNSNIIPALADLKQDIAGPIPVELIEAWAQSNGSAEAHEKILAPYKRVGTMASSDSAGLSKLTAGRPLVEVMKLVSQPKEIIYAHGTAIGGRAIGVWAADNTQMFYGDNIDPHDVVLQMVAAQREIQQRTLVRVGIGIDSGTAFEIGGGLYGAEADDIEDFTEDESEADEVIVTEHVKNRLRPPLDRIREMRGSMHVLDYADVAPPSRRSDDIFYPAPFDRAFHEAILRLDPTNAAQVDALHRERVKTKTIILVRMFHEPQTLLLDSFLWRVASNSMIHRLAPAYGVRIVKSNGSLAILAADDENEAVRFAVAVMEQAKIAAIPTNAGISKGDVLIFDLGNGTSDLAGSPVNIASKIAEDSPERGVIFVDSSVSEQAVRGLPAQPFTVEKSSVTIRGRKIA